MDAPEGIVRLYLAQRGRCFHCSKPMLMSPVVKRPSTGKINDGYTREHVIPLSAGGPRGLHNVVLAHSECNRKRGNRPLTERQIKQAADIWVRAAERERKEVKRIANDPVLRGTYMAVYDYLIDVGEPKYTTEMLTRWMKK